MMWWVMVGDGLMTLMLWFVMMCLSMGSRKGQRAYFSMTRLVLRLSTIVMVLWMVRLVLGADLWLSLISLMKLWLGVATSLMLSLHPVVAWWKSLLLRSCLAVSILIILSWAPR